MVADHQTVGSHHRQQVDSDSSEEDEDYEDSSNSTSNSTSTSTSYYDHSTITTHPHLPPSLIRSYRTRASNKSTFTPCEISKHNNISDCWIVAGNNVYDATSFLYSHPGGIKSILRYSGGRKDCTEDLMFHSQSARGIWERYKVGTLVECRGEAGWPRYKKASVEGGCNIS